MKAWVEDIFKAAQAQRGGIVRRSRADVDYYASLDEVIDAAKRRGFHVVESGDQVIILCHGGDIAILC